MNARTTTQTPFHIDLGWWTGRGQNLSRFLAAMLAPGTEVTAASEPLDFIDPVTAEVRSLDPVWVQVLLTRAHQPDFITDNTPITNAIFRALVENVNQPMSAIDLQHRLGRSTPETILNVLRTVRLEYGIVPVHAA